MRYSDEDMAMAYIGGAWVIAGVLIVAGTVMILLSFL